MYTTLLTYIVYIYTLYQLKYILHPIIVCEWTICTTYFFNAPIYFLGPSGQTTQDPHPGISSFFVFSYFSIWVVTWVHVTPGYLFFVRILDISSQHFTNVVGSPQLATSFCYIKQWYYIHLTLILILIDWIFVYYLYDEYYIYTFICLNI